MAHDVFVSYSQRDKPIADAVVAGLEGEGIRCWVAPRDILPGMSWGGSIVDAIAASRAMVLVLSAESNASAQVIREVERAVADGVILVPFRVEEVKPTGAMAYFLGPQHWLDAITPPLKGHIDRLCVTLGTLLEKAPVGEGGGSPVSAAMPTREAAAPSLAAPPAVRFGRVVFWYRKPVVWGLAALVVAAAIVVPLVLLLGGGEEPATTLAASTTVTTVPAATTAPPTTSQAGTTTTVATTTTMPAGAGLVWERVPHPQSSMAPYSTAATCFGCAVLGDATVRVGFEALDPGAGHLDAIVDAKWSQADWGRAADFGGPGNQGMTAVAAQGMTVVAAGGPGLVAVGWDDPTATRPYPPGGGNESGDADAAVWSSFDGNTWERVPHDEAVFGGSGDQMMTAVVAGGPGLVAVGFSLPDDRYDAVVWTSVDGFVWERVPHDDAVFGMSQMQGVVAGGPGLVAVGYTILRGSADAEVWTSTDGLVWERVPLQAALGGASQTVMHAVVAGGPGLVAVGYDDPGGDPDAAVWTSADGIVWERVPHDEAVFGGPERQDMEALATDGSVLVARGPGDDRGWGACWMSPPHAPTTTVVATTTTTAAPSTTMLAGAGLIWERVPQGDETAASHSPLATCFGCAALRDLTVRVGSEALEGGAGLSDPAVWGTFDLVNWWVSRPAGAPGNQVMTAVVAGGPGLVAVGWDQPNATVAARSPSNNPGADADAAVWTSTDGATWERVPHDEPVFGGPGHQMMTAVMAGGPGLVAVGWEELAGGLGVNAAVWTSTDGQLWERVLHHEAVFGSSRMSGVVAGGPGLVAVGWTSLRGSADAEVWTSTDGITWERVPLQAALGDGNVSQTMMHAVVAGGPGVVAVGFDDSGGDSDAAVWTSVDGIVWERVPHDEAIFGGPGGQDMEVLGTDGSVLVAWGRGGDPGEAFWVSPPRS